jgi:hypothetical protein
MTITAVEPIVFDNASACLRVSLDQRAEDAGIELTAGREAKG